MADPGWITFWALSGLCALLGLQTVYPAKILQLLIQSAFLVQFFTFLIILRVRNNEVPQNCWYGLWFSLFNIGIMWGMPIDVNGIVSVALAVTRLCITTDYQMPSPAFWALIIYLTVVAIMVPRLQLPPMPPTVRIFYLGNLGGVVKFAILIFNTYIDHQGILHLPGVQIPHYVTVAVIFAVILVANAIAYNGRYIPAVLLWFASIAIFYHHMWPWNEDFSWLWVVSVSISHRVMSGVFMDAAC